MNSKDKTFLEKFCVKESSNMTGLENFEAVGFLIIAGLRWCSPHQSKSDHISGHQSPPLPPPPPIKFLHSLVESLTHPYCGVHFHNLQFMTMKVCCRQKTFSPLTKMLEIPPAIGCFCRNRPIYKKSNLLF